MSLFERWNIERKLRWLHGWLGALILPWVILAGLTGLYLNHRSLILPLFPVTHLPDPAFYAAAGTGQAVETAAGAIATAARLRPGASYAITTDQTYAGRWVWTVDAGDDAVVIDRETGFTWIETRYRTIAYAPDGTRLATEWRWSRILSSLHTRGWVGTRLGYWPADLTAAALVVFGTSGLILFWTPRLRRRRNRRARDRAAR